MDNTHIRSSFYMVYSQPHISDVSSSRKRRLRLVETAEIQASLQSPLFFRLVEDGDRRCHSDLIWTSPVTLHFFSTLCAETLSLPYISSPGGDSHMKGVGILVVLLRGVTFSFWYRLVCFGQNTIIFC